MNNPEMVPAGSTPEAENQKIERDFQLAQRAAQNLRFGGGVRRSEEGALYTEIADVFVHEGLPELENTKLIKERKHRNIFKYIDDTPEAEDKRREILPKLELYETIFGLKLSEAVPVVFESHVFKDWLTQEGITLEDNLDDEKKERLISSFGYEVVRDVEMEMGGDWQNDEELKEKLASMLTVLRSPELYRQAESIYSEWGMNKFSGDTLPSQENFDLFERCKLDPSLFLERKLAQEEQAVKEKIRNDPFVSKALSCLEVVDGKLCIADDKKDVVEQLRQVYNNEPTPEQISLLILGARALFAGGGSREWSGEYGPRSLEERAVTFVTGQPTYFEKYDFDESYYRAVFDPARIYDMQYARYGGRQPKTEYPFDQAQVFAIFGNNGGEEAINNLKYFVEIGRAKALEEKLASDARRCFTSDDVGVRVATENPNLFECFKKLVESSQKLNSPGDTVLHHRHYTNAITDESCTCLAYRKTQGSSDSSPYSSNPYESRQTIVVLKEGKERGFSADNVSSFEVVTQGEQTRLVKHLGDGSTVEETVN